MWKKVFSICFTTALTICKASDKEIIAEVVLKIQQENI
jgi:hypothetical protein